MVKYIRHGECSHCGECCTGLVNTPTGVVEKPCFLYRKLPNGNSSCMGHGTHQHYLSGCNVFPSVPEHLAANPSCTYWFERVTDGQ